MHNHRSNQLIQLSIFDRLTRDTEQGLLGAAGEEMEFVRKAVLRDVEHLLNTRRRIVSPPGSYRLVNDSFYVYGLEDFVSKNPKDPHVKKALRGSIKKAIERFEPRLKDVSVIFNTAEGNERQLRFSISATLHADPIREPILFDTWFSVDRGEYRVQMPT
jgi:type VI secretion system protein ImpF